MRFLKYFLIAINLTLIILNLYWIDTLVLSYFRFVPSQIPQYVFGEKYIIIDDNKIKLPPGYYLTETGENYFSGPQYTANDCSNSSLFIEVFRPVQNCHDELIEFHLSVHYQPEYSNINDATTNIYSFYKFNGSAFALRRTASYFYHYLYYYKYYAFIPDKCIEITVFSFNKNLEDFLEIVKIIAFENQPGDFVCVKK